jgi:hypothetical protein
MVEVGLSHVQKFSRMCCRATCRKTGLSLVYVVAGIPDEWRRTIVTPIQKNGVAFIVPNYLQISLTCAACKVMKRVVVSGMLHYFREHFLITKKQCPPSRP